MIMVIDLIAVFVALVRIRSCSPIFVFVFGVFAFADNSGNAIKTVILLDYRGGGKKKDKK